MQLGLYVFTVCCWGFFVWYCGKWAFIVEYQDNFGVTIEDEEEYYKIAYITAHVFILIAVTYAAYRWVFEEIPK